MRDDVCIGLQEGYVFQRDAEQIIDDLLEGDVMALALRDGAEQDGAAALAVEADFSGFLNRCGGLFDGAGQPYPAQLAA